MRETVRQPGDDLWSDGGRYVRRRQVDVSLCLMDGPGNACVAGAQNPTGVEQCAVAIETSAMELRAIVTPPKPAPCIWAMDMLIETAMKAGEREPRDEDKAKFMSLCEEWPKDVKLCFADARDENAIGACLQQVMKIEMDKAMKAAGEEAEKAAAETAD